MYRHATYADIPFIIDLLREFYAIAGAGFDIPFCPKSTMMTVREVIDEGLCMVGPSSCAGIRFDRSPFNHQYVIGAVIFWYFRSAREITIFEVAKGKAKEMGANKFAAVSLFPANAIQRYYQRIGLKPVEIASITNL